VQSGVSLPQVVRSNSMTPEFVASAKHRRFWSLKTRFGVVAGLILSMGLLWNSNRLVTGPVLCPFRLVTGHPCPFCGSTRALGAMCAGDVQQAWSLNPLAVLVWLLAVTFWLRPSWAQTMSVKVMHLQLRVGALPSYTFIGILFLAVWYWNVATRW